MSITLGLTDFSVERIISRGTHVVGCKVVKKLVPVKLPSKFISMKSAIVRPSS